MAETQSAPSLRERSERAAGGEWFASVNGADGLCRIDNGAEMWPLIGEWPEAELAMDLVNAFRAGRLIDPTTLTEALATARAEGVREGLKRAAGIIEKSAVPALRGVSAAIRALIPAPPTTSGGRTDG